MGQPVFSQFDHEQLYEEAIRMKQALNQRSDENTRLRTRVKMLETEMARKEKSIEDFFQQNQFIQNAQKQAGLGANLAPIAQTAQRYQQETFLVMSLKKQVKELKGDLNLKVEQIEKWRRNAKVTRFVEMEAELDLCRSEMQRMRLMLEGQFAKDGSSSMQRYHSQPQPQAVMQQDQL